MALAPDAALHPLFTQAATEHASDLHLVVGQPPVMRTNGELKHLSDKPPYTAETLLANIDQLLTPELQARYRAERDLDTLVILSTGERFRVSLFWEKEMPALAARFIPAAIP